MKKNICKQWQQAVELVTKWTGNAKKQPRMDLIDMIEQAKREWQIALKQLDFCDRDLLDYMVHHIQAKERRYMALLQQARQENITAWQLNCQSDNTGERERTMG